MLLQTLVTIVLSYELLFSKESMLTRDAQEYVILGLILLSVGTSRLKIENIMPNRTVHQLRRDASVAKEQVSQDHELRRAA